MTEALSTGGHTRVVSEWVKNTSESAIHGVVITAQQQPIPKDLFNSLKSNGGWHKFLMDYSQNMLIRSYLLRQLSRDWADVVVLHIHPSDTISFIAFGCTGGPPVILFNHAGHLFWLGALALLIL